MTPRERQALHNKQFKLPGPTMRDLLDGRRNYSPEASARFVRHYRTVARGMMDALYIESLPWKCVMWLCGRCDKVSRDHPRRFDDHDLIQCDHCGALATEDEVKLGTWTRPVC